MIASLTCTVTFLPEVQHNPLSETINPLCSMQRPLENERIPCWLSSTKTKKCYLPLQKTLVLALQVDTNILLWSKNNFRGLKHSVDRHKGNCTGPAKFVLYHGTKLDGSTMMGFFYSLSIASQVRYFTPSIKAIDEVLLAFCHNSLYSEEWLFICITQNARTDGIKTIT